VSVSVRWCTWVCAAIVTQLVTQPGPPGPTLACPQTGVFGTHEALAVAAL